MNKKVSISKYGADCCVIENAALYPELQPARIISQYKGMYKIALEQEEVFAEISGKFRYETKELLDYPVVGDYVMVSRNGAASSGAVIHHVMPRKSLFRRTAVGIDNQAQAVAANIDIAFLCMALNNDYNLSRLERYLSAAWDSGAIPVIVLTKSDLCQDLQSVLLEVSAVAFGTDTLVTSGFDKESCQVLLSYLKEGITGTFIGSSGIGKSTLINCLMGDEIMEVSETRSDDKGRHTTTRRELLFLPQGGMVIDTPGMREFGLESADFSRSFADIDELAEMCRFNDCTHTKEPSCAVLAAIADGTLDERRFRNYEKLKKEVKYEGLSSKQIETEKLNSMFEGVGGMKKARDFIKQKNKRR